MLHHDGAALAYRRDEGRVELVQPMQLALIDDAKIFNDKLREWEDYDNYHRPHGGLGGQTPTNDSEPKPAPRCNR
jgi:hypothetical protein